MADPGGPFGLVPRVLYRRYFEPDENFQVPMSLNCLLVQVADQVIVVDTGLGTRLDEKQRTRWGLSRPDGDLIAGLSRLGVTPGDVTLVIDTHLHADHCSGNTRMTESGEIVPTFPHAEYVVQRREFEDATHPNERTAGTYYSANWDVLVENDQLRLLDGETELAPGIWGVVAPGHTPGHMAVRFERDGQHALFVCDMASYAVHFEKLAWMTAYDVEPLVTLETKRYWRQWALAHDAVVMFPHDPKRPAGRVRQDERGRLLVDPLAEPFA